MLYKVHDNVDLVRIGAYNDLANSDDVGVLRDEQSVDLSQRRDGKPLFLTLHLQSFQSNSLVGPLDNNMKI